MKFPTVSSLYKHQIKDIWEVRELNSTWQGNCASNLVTSERGWNLEPKIWSSGDIWPSKIPLVFRAIPGSFLTSPKINKTFYGRTQCRPPSRLLNTQQSPKHKVLQTNQLQRFFLFIIFCTASSLFPQADWFPNYTISTDQINCKSHLKNKNQTMPFPVSQHFIWMEHFLTTSLCKHFPSHWRSLSHKVW